MTAATPLCVRTPVDRALLASRLVKNIVVGLSAAETSQTAVRQAFELAEATGAMVHVLTAVDDDEFAVIEVGSDRFEFSDSGLAKQAADAFVQRLAPKVKWRSIVVEERPAAALIDEARRIDADLIVVGNVRMQGIGRVLGSVGNEVVHHAPCNVLIVKTV